MATEIRVHKQKKKSCKNFIKNVGMKSVRRGYKTNQVRQIKNIHKERNRGSKEKGNNAQ